MPDPDAPAEQIRRTICGQVADMLGISRQRARTLSERADFPAPVALMRRGPIWRVEDIEVWAEQVGRSVRPLPPADEE